MPKAASQVEIFLATLQALKDLGVVVPAGKTEIKKTKHSDARIRELDNG